VSDWIVLALLCLFNFVNLSLRLRRHWNDPQPAAGGRMQRHNRFLSRAALPWVTLLFAVQGALLGRWGAQVMHGSLASLWLDVQDISCGGILIAGLLVGWIGLYNSPSRLVPPNLRGERGWAAARRERRLSRS
jgi:hypothetical protein